jgi:magnesium transporter
VVNSAGVLRGLVRGEELFREQAIEISAQPGQMVGVEREERLATPLRRSLKLRHPWLQINLVTAFIAAAVVGAFEDTLSKLVILAVFLPVLAGQSGNTGCQALAVALLGMTVYATMQGEAQPLLMGGVVMVAMMASCVIAGLAGALIPLTLKRLGADPATASSIFLTTASDVASMGIFLSLATVLLL